MHVHCSVFIGPRWPRPLYGPPVFYICDSSGSLKTPSGTFSVRVDDVLCCSENTLWTQRSTIVNLSRISAAAAATLGIFWMPIDYQLLPAGIDHLSTVCGKTLNLHQHILGPTLKYEKKCTFQVRTRANQLIIDPCCALASRWRCSRSHWE